MSSVVRQEVYQCCGTWDSDCSRITQNSQSLSRIDTKPRDPGDGTTAHFEKIVVEQILASLSPRRSRELARGLTRQLNELPNVSNERYLFRIRLRTIPDGAISWRRWFYHHHNQSPPPPPSFIIIILLLFFTRGIYSDWSILSKKHT